MPLHRRVCLMRLPALMAAATLPARASTPVLRVLTLDYPPLVQSVGGETQGLATQVLRAAAQRAGLRLHIEVVPWARAQKDAQEQPGLLIYPVIRSAAREALYDWIAPVAPIQYQLFRRRTDAHLDPPRRIEDLPLQRVGLVRGDVVSALLAQRGLRVRDEVARIEPLVKMLLVGRVDFIAATPEALRYGLQALGAPPDAVVPALALNLALSDGMAYVVTRRGSSSEFTRRLALALDEMQRDGSWGQVYGVQSAQGK